MSRKTTPRETEKPKKLTRAQKKEIDAVIRKYKGDGKPRTAQATIPYEAIYPDGVCRIDRRTFSKCRGILSPLRLPVPPWRRVNIIPERARSVKHVRRRFEDFSIPPLLLSCCVLPEKVIQ